MLKETNGFMKDILQTNQFYVRKYKKVYIILISVVPHPSLHYDHMITSVEKVYAHFDEKEDNENGAWIIVNS